LTRFRIALAPVLRAVLVSLAAGWLVALVFGLWIARLQYADVSAAFPPDKIAAEYEARLDRELRQGPLLLLIQVGVMAGALVWQVGGTARHAPAPILHGTFAGLALALIQGTIAVLMHAPWAFIAPLVAALIGVGVYAGWSAAPGDKPVA
jgi:hypothetical protein